MVELKGFLHRWIRVRFEYDGEVRPPLRWISMRDVRELREKGPVWREVKKK